MEPVVVLAALLGFLWLLRRSVFRTADLSDALGALYVGFSVDGWPRGLQEEDPDRPWGRPRPSPPTAHQPLDGAILSESPGLARVKPVVRVR